MNPRTKLQNNPMPKWIWELRRKGFHVQLKKYLHFLWRQRPEGCNWSRELRARYFNRTYHTIAKWDAYLVKAHLVWTSHRGTLMHRIGARPYYDRQVWMVKSGQLRLVPARVTNYTPYTAQQKNNSSSYSSSAELSFWDRKALELKGIASDGDNLNLPPDPPSKGEAVQGLKSGDSDAEKRRLRKAKKQQSTKNVDKAQK